MRSKTPAKLFALITLLGGVLMLSVGSAQGQGFSAAGVLLQPDGKIVAVGSGSYSSKVNSRFALSRYRATGSLDTTFGTRGRVLTSLGASSGAVSAAALQPDGKIVAAGTSSAGPTVRFALARYEPDGSLDTTFGTGGKVATAIGPGTDLANAVALQPDGKIILAGWSRRVARGAPSGFDFALARFNPDGSLDQSFGTAGKVTTAIAGAWGDALALQPDGKIVLAGAAQTPALQDRFALARYNPDGSLDTSFGAGGVVMTAISEHASISSLALQPDGKLVAAGAECGARCYEGVDFALARYNPDGSLDTSFGSAGIVTTAIGLRTSGAHAVALQPDGKIVVAGFGGLPTFFALARYTVNGALDPSFGAGGKVMTSFICVVPRLKGRSLATAKHMILRTHCSVGQVKRSFSRTVRKGRLISQRPTPRSQRFAGAKVNLVVSKGRKR